MTPEQAEDQWVKAHPGFGGYIYLGDPTHLKLDGWFTSSELEQLMKLHEEVHRAA